MKFTIKDFFSKFTEEILNGELHFLCSDDIKFCVLKDFLKPVDMSSMQLSILCH